MKWVLDGVRDLFYIKSWEGVRKGFYARKRLRWVFFGDMFGGGVG